MWQWGQSTSTTKTKSMFIAVACRQAGAQGKLNWRLFRCLAIAANVSMEDDVYGSRMTSHFGLVVKVVAVAIIANVKRFCFRSQR